MGKLIRLELFNFKSYKGHHVLLFGDSYFTSIIGPNGSGKSNSMDAISFVLGIKSSHLRSTHLRDLVYRGRVLKTSVINADGAATDAPAETNGQQNGDTNGRAGSDDEASQPQSQGGDPTTAWVVAVYEDDTGEEQKWKRSITSAGQSEYRINDRVVGAKQYNEALEMENILIKARNFLVFQGDVEAIASQSPRDLTRLVEQISGSLEYKADYDRLAVEAEKTAEEQNFKLTQRRSLNSEIKQYQEQKREADNFSRKSGERDEAVVTHVLWKLFHFQRVMEESGAKIQEHQEELKEFRRGVEKYEQRFENAKREQAKAGREVSKQERNIKRKQKEIEDKENDLVPINEKISISNKKLKQYNSRIAEITRERETQSKNVEQLRQDLRKVQRAQEKWEEEWRQRTSQQGRQLNDVDMQEYNRLRAEVSRRTAADQIRLDNLARQQRTDEETVNSLRSQIKTLEAKVQKFDTDIAALVEQRRTVETNIRQTSEEVEAKRRELNNTTSERLRTEQKNTELNEKLREVLNKLSEADDGRRQSEKELRARETTAAMKRIFPGVRGRIGDLCRPKQRKFDIAVSTVLGRNMDAVVVDTEKTAKDCIQYLRDQRAGQATFIPLDTIQVKSVNSNLKGMHRNMRLAIDTVEYDSIVERAMLYACGNAMVCDDLETAKYLCYEKNIEAKAVTLDGTVIHKGGLMTGGRGPGDKNGRRWDEIEVENLRKLKDKLMAELAGLPKSHRSVTQEETLRGELTGLEQRLTYLRQESQSLDRNLESKRSELGHTQQQIEETRPRFQQKDQALESLRGEMQGYRDRIASVEDEVFAAFCQRLGYSDIRAYEAQQGGQQQEGVQKRLEFTKQLSRLENQLTFETQRLESTNERIRVLEEQRRRDEDLIAELEGQKDSMNNELDVSHAELERLTETLDRAKGKYDERTEAVTAARSELHKRSKSVDSALKEITGLEADLRRNALLRFNLLRKCKMDEIRVPLTDSSATLESLPVSDLMAGTGPDPMVTDGEEESQGFRLEDVQDYGIELDYSELDDELKEDASEQREAELQAAIANLTNELSSLAPNHRVMERLQSVQERLRATEREFDAARRAAKKAREEFEEVKEKRLSVFNKAFSHIAEQIGGVYKELTRSPTFPLGGQAYLDTEDSELPFAAGLKYHAMPPLKRFRDIEHLSGGEKTIAALALLFAVHSYQPSPFFVLDEVDAALDSVNVARVAHYLSHHAGPGMQFVVISLKTGLFQESETLVGVMRDQQLNSSRTLTLDLRKYQRA